MTRRRKMRLTKAQWLDVLDISQAVLLLIASTADLGLSARALAIVLVVAGALTIVQRRITKRVVDEARKTPPKREPPDATT